MKRRIYRTSTILGIAGVSFIFGTAADDNDAFGRLLIVVAWFLFIGGAFTSIATQAPEDRRGTR